MKFIKQKYLIIIFSITGGIILGLALTFALNAGAVVNPNISYLTDSLSVMYGAWFNRGSTSDKQVLIDYNTGNVGIGTTNPTAKLDVDGAINAGSGSSKGSVIHNPCSVVNQYSSNAGWSTAQASCPANTILTGGGGNCSGYSAALHISYPLSSNTWLAACGNSNIWGPTPTTAYAICCRTD